MASKIKKNQSEDLEKPQGRELFQTPNYAVDLLVPFLKTLWNKSKQFSVWECAAGEGKIVNRLESYGFRVYASELNPKSKYTVSNFLTENCPINFPYPNHNNTCIVTNPPFSLKKKFYLKCLEYNVPFALLIPADYSGWMIDALRINMDINKIYCVDNITGMSQLVDNTVQLVVTSPPYADMRKYENFKGIHPDKYVEWFLPIGKEIFRVINDGGSFVLNINDKVVNGFRHTYVFSLVLELEKLGFNLWERFFWNKPNPMPGMGGKRFRDATEYIFWFTKGKPYLDMSAVKTESISSEKIKNNATFGVSRGGSNFTVRTTSKRYPEKVVPTNILTIRLGNTYKSAEKHPAIFPEQIPEFFIKATTKNNDIVLDPFSGSGTTCFVAKKLGRNYIGFDITNKYVETSNRRLSE